MKKKLRQNSKSNAANSKWLHTDSNSENCIILFSKLKSYKAFKLKKKTIPN